MKEFNNILTEKFDQAENYLRFINSNDRINCLKVFSILKREFGDNGFELANRWAGTTNNYCPRWVKENWRSANDSLFGFPVLHLMARDGGFIAPRQVITKHCPAPNVSNCHDKIRYANSIWARANTDDEHVGLHPYAIAKEIHWAAGAGRGSVSGRLIGENADCLLIPIYDLNTDSLQGVQCVNAKGVKQTFGRVKGGGLIFGNSLRLSGDWAVAEGWASTVACVHWHGFDCAVCSFGNSRFDEVYDLVSNRFSPKKIFMMGENDD